VSPAITKNKSNSAVYMCVCKLCEISFRIGDRCKLELLQLATEIVVRIWSTFRNKPPICQRPGIGSTARVYFADSSKMIIILSYLRARPYRPQRRHRNVVLPVGGWINFY